MSDGNDSVRRFTESWDGPTTDIEIESVAVDQLTAGDHIVVSPGERIPRAGRLIAVDGSDDRAPAFTAVGETCRVETDEGVESRSVGSRVAAGESVRDRTVIVEVGRGGVATLLPTGALGFSGRLGGRIAVVTLVVLITLAGAGVGAISMFGGGGGGDPVGPGTPTETPPAPEVTVTPPGTATPESSETPTPPEETPTGPTSGSDAPTATATPGTDTPTGTATPTASPTPTATSTSGGNTGGDSGTDDAQPPRVSVDAEAGDPPAYQAADGRVSSVSGTVSGSVSWSGVDADSVVIVVQTWLPGAGWAEVERVTVSGAALDGGTVDLETALGSVEYADAARTGGLTNPDPGTTATRTGRVAVTAVAFADGAEAARTTVEDEFETTVEHVEFDLALGSASGDGGSFSFDGGATDALTPGQRVALVGNLTNTGEMAGQLSIARVNVTDFENGQTAPERAVDSTGGDPGVGAGELSEALEVRVLVRDGDGETSYALGGEDSYVPLSALTDGETALGTLDAGETAELTVEMRVPPDVGNEIQTDSVDIDLAFALTSA
ncbi:hypothetical protein [Halosegnis longus]|uniref:P-type ATPase A domain-containing protein n=1 Tax=Halosegnis longus TaxID=2216012 RepID=A0AAJ4R8H3_9EURY|nr:MULTISPECIES: hypothetical protein [Halobacteriales]RNJ26219.1 hypothetical protein Nmn1133_05705 [Salella cibi]